MSVDADGGGGNIRATGSDLVTKGMSASKQQTVLEQFKVIKVYAPTKSTRIIILCHYVCYEYTGILWHYKYP